MKPINPNASRLMGDLIFATLKSEASGLNRLATELLVAMGGEVVHELIAEARTSKKIGYKLRLLRVIQNIGEVPVRDDHLELFTISGDKDPRVRAAAARAIAAVGPHSSRRRGVPVGMVESFSASEDDGAASEIQDVEWYPCEPADATRASDLLDAAQPSGDAPRT